MPTQYTQANRFHRFIRTVATKRPIIWLFSRLLPPLDRGVFRWTNGRRTLTSLLAGLPMIHLTTIGAKSGQPRVTPLAGIPDGDEIVLIASNWGQKKYPGWYYNLLANPEVVVGQDGRSTNYIAQEVTGARRDACWQLATQYYLGFNTYAQRASHRHIPVIVLTPK